MAGYKTGITTTSWFEDTPLVRNHGIRTLITALESAGTIGGWTGNMGGFLPSACANLIIGKFHIKGMGKGKRSYR